MITNKPPEQSNRFTDQAANVADGVIKSTQRVTNDTLNSLADKVQSARDYAAPVLNRTTEQVKALTQHGVEFIHDRTQQLQDKGRQVSQNTVSYVKNQPVKAVLIAAATGAALMALVNLFAKRVRSQGNSD